MEWTVWYEEHGWSPLTSSGLNACLTRGLKTTTGTCFSQTFDLVYQGDHTFIATPKDELDAMVQAFVERIVADPEWADSFNSAMMEKADVLRTNAEKNASNATTASNEELARYRNEFNHEIEDHLNYGLLPVIAESNEGALSQRYYEIVRPKIGAGNFAAIASLLAPSVPSAHLVQHTEMNELTVAAKKSGSKNVQSALLQHFHTWQWLPYAFVGPAWTEEKCRKEFDTTATVQTEELERQIHDAKTSQKRIENARENLMRRYGFDRHERQLTNVIARFESTKYKRKENYSHAHFHYHTILAQTAKRLHASIPQARMLTPEETQTALDGGSMPDLAGRMNGAVYLYRNGKATVRQGGAIREYQDAIQPKTPANKDALSGQCACPGSATGRACIVNTQDDVKRMQQGDIVVSYATYPELMPALRQAAAIVTDRGGVTCHAAIVSRELGIPCVIGTKNATQVFKNGDLLDVDATAGIVRKTATH